MEKRSLQNEPLLVPEKNKVIPFQDVSSLYKGLRLLFLMIMFLTTGFFVGQRYQSNRTASVVPVPKVPEGINVLPVETIEVQEVSTYETTRSYTGEVTALRTSEVGMERGGKLVTVLVEEGDVVRKGAVLAQLDTSNLEAQRQGLIAEKAQAQAVLDELNNGARPEQIASAAAKVQEIQQQLGLEKLKTNRREYLYREGAIAKEQLDEVAFNRQALQQRLAEAQSNLNELQNGTRSEQIAAQTSTVDILTARIAELDITIAKSSLKSPFDGTVAYRHLDEGTVVNAGQSIVRLIENDRLEVRIGIPVETAQTMQPGTTTAIKIGGNSHQATVNSLLPEVDPRTRIRTVILKLTPTAARQVTPGEIARLDVTKTIATDGYWLPITALIKGDRGLWSCYSLVENNEGQTIVERQYVEILSTQEDRVLVKGTIQPGDVIVANGIHRLVPGQIVSKKSEVRSNE